MDNTVVWMFSQCFFPVFTQSAISPFSPAWFMGRWFTGWLKHNPYYSYTRLITRSDLSWKSVLFCVVVFLLIHLFWRIWRNNTPAGTGLIFYSAIELDPVDPKILSDDWWSSAVLYCVIERHQKQYCVLMIPQDSRLWPLLLFSLLCLTN